MKKTLNLVSWIETESAQLSKKQWILFAVLSVLSAVFLYTALLTSVGFSFDFSPDEPFYLLICERMLRGDRLIVDEWALPQFLSIFQFLPYALFRAITGSTQGVILYMRYLFIGASFLNYLYILFRYRKRPWLAVSLAYLFSSFVPLCAFLLGYYYLPLLFLFAFASIIIDETAKHRKLRLVFAGILLSAVVILNPGTALVWLVYCAFVAIRFAAQKKGHSLFADYGFILDIDTFKYILYGILISVAALFSYFQISCGLGSLLENLQNIEMDTDRSKVLGLGYFAEKTQEWIETYAAAFWLMLCETAAVLVFRLFKRKTRNPVHAQRWLFVLNCFALLVFCISLYIRLFSKVIFILMEPPIFFAWFGLNCFLLCKKTEPKMLVFWLIGATLSFTQDITSKVSYGFGSVLCILPAAAAAMQCTRELSTEWAAGKQQQKKRASCSAKLHFSSEKTVRQSSIVLAFLAFVLLSWSVINVLSFSSVYRHHPLNQKRSIITQGPYRGINMPENYKTLHDDILSDLDTLRDLTKEPIYIMGGHPFGYPFGYLYLDRDINVMSSANTVDFENDHERYWREYPEKRPNYVYIPLEEDASPIAIPRSQFNGMASRQQMDFGWFEGEAIKGKAGLIVRVSQWNANERFSIP